MIENTYPNHLHACFGFHLFLYDRNRHKHRFTKSIDYAADIVHFGYNRTGPLDKVYLFTVSHKRCRFPRIWLDLVEWLNMFTYFSIKTSNCSYFSNYKTYGALLKYYIHYFIVTVKSNHLKPKTLQFNCVKTTCMYDTNIFNVIYV